MELIDKSVAVAEIERRIKETKQEDKDLLLKDLCERLPYGVKVYAGEDLAMTLRQIDYECFCEAWENEDFQSHSRWMLPYLRQMSSMTEEERVERNSILWDLECPIDEDVIYKYQDWLNKKMFDYRGLIPMGLALEAPEGMYRKEAEK